LGELGLGLEEFYSMTWGNFQRVSLGYIKRQWVVNRELLAAIVNGYAKEKVTGEQIFSFGITKEKPEAPTEDDRDYMAKRHEHTLKRINELH
jgi:hypothetical protein